MTPIRLTTVHSKMKPVLHITRGLPSSGKTTWAKAWVAESPDKRARVNRDDLRAMLHDSVWRGHPTEKQVVAVRDAAIKALLQQGIDVVCDDTNLPQKICVELAKLANSVGSRWLVNDEFSRVPLEMCLNRDAKRTKPVGQQAILDMYEKFLRDKVLERVSLPEDKPAQTYTPPVGKPRAVLVDLDGTLALLNGRGPYDESKVEFDLLNKPVAAVVRAMVSVGYEIVFMSGRTMGCRDASSRWLVKQFGDVPWVTHANLLMRASGDSRKDSIVKRELFDTFVREHFDVVCVLDDRAQVVEMWRELGLTCLQVAPGNF